MPKARVDPFALNPEKLLAPKKASQAWPAGYALDDVIPLRFSKTWRKALIAQFAKNRPGAFYLGPDMEKQFAAIAQIREGIAVSLGELRVVPDETLVGFLVADVMSDPAWRRACRAQRAKE